MPTPMPTPTPVVPTPASVAPTPVVPTPAPTPTPTPSTEEGVSLEAGGDAQPRVLNAQPSAPVKPNDPSLDTQALKHYQVVKRDVLDTNLTLPAGVKAYLHLGAVQVNLPAGNSTIKVYCDNAYRTVSNGDKLIVSLDDQIALLRLPYIEEIPDVQISLTIE